MKKQLNLLTVFAVTAVFLAPSGVFAAEDTAKLLAEKKAELNGHEWEIKLVPSSDPKNGTQTNDTLVFRDMKFEAKGMTEKGYQPTNYTITLQEGGPTVWETMQSSETGPAVFWRAEWEGESMRGVMSKQNADGTSEAFYFSSVSSKVVPDTPKVEAPAAVPAPADAVPAVEAVQEAAAPAPAVVEEVKQEAAPVVEEKKEEKKKKKGWF